MESYRCQSCGAEILINDTTGSGFSKCIYCGSNVTLFKKEYSKLNIKKMVPFRTSEEEAINYLTNVLNYTRRNEILDVKRIFIPVRFCSYDFSYLCSYRYVVSSDEDGTTYDNNDSLIDGSVKEEMILETSIMNNLLGFHDLRGVPREDFDPIKLGRISCEFSEKVREKDPQAIKLAKEYDAFKAKKQNRAMMAAIFDPEHFDRFNALLTVHKAGLISGIIIFK